MTSDLDLLAERVAAVERHLARVAQKLPATPGELAPNTDTSDAVILHLWQATQTWLRRTGRPTCVRSWQRCAMRRADLQRNAGMTSFANTSA
jgi:endonuclease III